jgi:hypothetical protein
MMLMVSISGKLRLTMVGLRTRIPYMLQTLLRDSSLGQDD